MYAGLVALTVVMGAVVRFVPVGLPAVAVKYGGSGLWALCFYWAFRMTGVRGRWALVAAFGVTAGVEWFKLYRSPGVDAFRGTLAGVLLLGRYFSWWDVLAYWAAIGVGCWVDWVWVRRWVRVRFVAE